MHAPSPSPGLARLAPLAFAAGTVLLGLGLLVFSFAAGGAQPRALDYHEEGVVNGTAYLGYPIPLEGRSDLRLDVAFRYPETGRAFTTGCSDYAAFKAGGAALARDMRTEGREGRFSTSLPASSREGAPFLDDDGCPFLYVVFAWDAPTGDVEANRPEVKVVVTSILTTGYAGFAAVIATLVGALLAVAGAIGWNRRLGAAAAPPAADEESTAETLLRVVERSERWLERTRRYLVVGGVLGVFLWYPILLPWSWRMLIQGSRDEWLGWLLGGGALALLLVLTVVWVREYARLDRELTSWRARLARLRTREAQLVSRLDG